MPPKAEQILLPPKDVTMAKTPIFRREVVDDPEATLRRAGLNVQPVPRMEDPTPEKLRRVVAADRMPMLFAGLVDDWPARTAWTPENLAVRHGHTTVTALMDLPAGGVLF